ncbi:MAG: methyltransferase domain-containing protein [Ignavibacteriae bacterium]|nr:methyltransferase domain-containing protein [Ignavibacteriota bacterium]
MSCRCTSTEGANTFFSEEASQYLKKFRKKGLAKEQRYLAEGILSTNVTGKSILEIGSGVGGLHLTLLKDGARAAFGIDLAEGMVDGAKQLSHEMGFSDLASYRAGDFAHIADEIAEADIVILDKVVCCYEDVDDLVAKSLSKTRGVYALSFPRPIFPVKLSFQTMIAIGKLFKWPFRPYWHDWDAMLKKIRADGFQEVAHRDTFVWAAYVFRR